MNHGIINVYKEAGYTSHDVVARLRGIFGQKKIGHTGTLDPDAEGVLLVCLGKATKVCDMLTDWDKTYRATMVLGTVTDTQDVSGEVLERHEVNVTEEGLRDAVPRFVGDQMQVPPMYSALKFHGKKLYELAREGKVVERKPRPVHIYEIKVCEINFPQVTIEVTCGKGTYIRTLCHDIGNGLGCGGCMGQLTRTRVGIFQAKDSRKLDEIEAMVRADRAKELIRPVDTLFSDCPKITVRETYRKALENGNRLPLAALEQWDTEWEGRPVRVYGSEGTFAGIYEYMPRGGDIKPRKIFLEKD